MATNQQEHYLINMADGRRILYTKQAARQINYHPITQEVAYAIDEGRLTWQEVVARIKANLIKEYHIPYICAFQHRRSCCSHFFLRRFR